MKTRTLLLVFCLLLGGSSLWAAAPVRQWGQLRVEGTQLYSEHGEPVVLRGVSFGWHNIWPRFYNAGAVKWLKTDWQANVVRAAMGIMIDDNYLENPDFAVQCIENVVKAAIRNDMYVIVDWHSHKMHTAEAATFFAGIAQRYGRYPHLIYEIYNEPIDDSWDSLKAYASAVITAIRQYDPDNVVLVGCPHWDQDIHLVAESPLRGYSNIMYTVHFYAATHGGELRRRMVDAVKAGVPVFVSECAGMEASGNGRLDPGEWQKWVDTMEQYRISWVCWSVSDKDETCSMLLPRAKSRGKWGADVLKPWGKMVRETLVEYNNK